LVAPLSKYQPFRETNHRTAFVVARYVLDENGRPGLIPENDVELGDILAQDRDPNRSLATQVKEIRALLQERLGEQTLEEGPAATRTERTPQEQDEFEFERFETTARALLRVTKEEIRQPEQSEEASGPSDQSPVAEPPAGNGS
jgi:hypothetical protein